MSPTFSKEQDALGTSLCWCRERAWHSSQGEKSVMWGIAVQPQLARHRIRYCSCFKHKGLNTQLRDTSDENMQFPSQIPN